jgi:hypothetical protein
VRVFPSRFFATLTFLSCYRRFRSGVWASELEIEEEYVRWRTRKQSWAFESDWNQPKWLYFFQIAFLTLCVCDKEFGRVRSQGVGSLSHRKRRYECSCFSPRIEFRWAWSSPFPSHADGDGKCRNRSVCNAGAVEDSRKQSVELQRGGRSSSLGSWGLSASSEWVHQSSRQEERGLEYSGAALSVRGFVAGTFV